MSAPDAITEIARSGSIAPSEALRLIGLAKAYGSDLRQLAVRHIDLLVHAGEFMTLLGPSGSGKTTTLMMIAGFEEPSRGEILIRGVPVTNLPPHRRNLSMVFQGYALFPHRTVARNVAFALEMRRRPRAEIADRVRDALAMVRLSGLEDRLPHQLSGGQQQRVALARAIVFEPQVLLMDEPLGALDKNLREQMQIEIKDLQRRLNVTVIYVTHDQQEALTMSDRITVMNDGRIEQIGAPEELYDQPCNRFVAGFLGESNFIDGKVTTVGPGDEVELVTRERLPFMATGASPPPIGADAIAALRPERIWIAGPGGGHPGDVAWPAIVQSRLFVGDTLKYRVMAGGLTLAVKVQNGARSDPHAPGDEVLVGWSANHARLLSN